MKKLSAALAVALFALAALAETPPSSPCGASNNGATTIDAHGTTWGCNAQYKQWNVVARTTVNTGGDQQIYDSKTFNGPTAFNGLVTMSGYATKMIWGTPDPIQNNNNGGSNTRILVGPLTGVAGTVASLNCQPQQRGDGGGRLYVTLAEVTDGGYTALCATDLDSCDLADITANQLGFQTLSSPACSTALSASKVYMYSFGQPTDGGPKCGLNTPILNCTTIINPP